MAYTKAPHHKGAHQRIARQVTAAANANPATRCMGHCTCHALVVEHCTCGQACGKTLAEHGLTKTGKRPTWTGGHARDSDPTSPYRPEVKSCGCSAGATMGNRMRTEPHSERW